MTRLFTAIALSAALLSTGTAGAEELLIIANPSVDVPVPLPLNQIAAIYLLRITTWPDGSHIVPINREASSATRADFTDRVLGESNADLTVYWNEMHFTGKFPPVVQESQQAVIAFIRNVPGSIGYIHGATAPAAVKIVAYVP
jgi:ABC-type phosphate transport system substrate-binding protein